jgi:glycosyltransferase involved in cell wall biosynthesis
LIGSFLPANAAVARQLRVARIPYFLSPSDALHPALCHGPKGFAKEVFGRIFEREVALAAAGIRFYSNEHSRPWKEHGYLRGGQSFILHDGIDSEQIAEMTGGTLDEEALAEWTPTAAPIFGSLGRIAIYQKGLDRLLRAWDIYKRQGGAGVLRMHGPPHKRDGRRLFELMRRLRLQGVSIAGPIRGSEKFAFLRELTVLVHPSRHESAGPRVTRESLAIGCPMIVTRDTNIHEVVQEFEAGWVTDGDPAALAQAMWAAAQVRDMTRFRRSALEAAASLDWGLLAARWLDEIGSRIGSVR